MTTDIGLKDDGIHEFGAVVDPEKAAAIDRKARQLRKFGPELFLTREEYEADPKHWGVNPRPGFNFIDRFEGDLDCVEGQPEIGQFLREALGADYRIHNKKFVCGVPTTWLPEYLRQKMESASIDNLGAYIRPEFRDITYFHGIDFHQDIIDWPAWKAEDKTHEFLTLYVYIHDVTTAEAPLVALPGSHRFGATRFPHSVDKIDATQWRYSNRSGEEMICPHRILTGPTGYAAVWHSCLLHGTSQVAASGDCRLSLRYIMRRVGSPGRLTEINQKIAGPLYLESARVDLDKQGKVTMLNNNIRQMQKV